MDVVSRWMNIQTKSRYTYGASLTVVGVVCCVVATRVIMMGDTYVDAMQLALVRLPNLATTPTVSGLAAIPHFPVLPTLLVQSVKIECHFEAPKEMPPSSNRICSRTRSCSRPSFKRFCRRQPKTELKNRVSTTRASRIWQAARALWKLRTCISSRLL